MVEVVGRAVLLKGAVSFKDGGIPNLGDTFKAPILLTTGETRLALVKSLPQRELANEVYAASLAVSLGLAVPEPFLVYAAANDLPVGRAPAILDGSLVFASTEVKGHSVAQIVVKDVGDKNVALNRIAKAIVSAGRVGEAYCFDAWSANIDRHVGNWLLSSEGNWLIDHGRCFSGSTWVPSDLQSDQSYRHRLKEWLTPRLSEREKDTLLAESTTVLQALNGLDVRTIGVENDVPTLVGNADFEALVCFLVDRIAHTARISADALNRLA